MFFMLIATFAAGVVAAGVALIVPRLIGKRAPRHLPPVAAGLAMFGFMIWNEYSWFDRTVESFPPDVRVAATYTSSSALQPWTLIKPRINRLAVVDMARAKRNPAMPDLVMAEVLLITRFEDTASVMQLFDCAGSRRADAPAGDLTPDWTPDWHEPDAEDPLLRVACGG